MNRNALKMFFLCTMAAAAFIVFIVSINAGYSHLSLADIFKGLLGNGESSTRLIIQQIRLPRILVSLLCGLSGCILQSVTGNPLADPGILGINNGAAVAVMVFLVYFPDFHTNSTLFMPIFAFVGALVVALLLYLFAFRSGRLNSGYFLLGGIAAAAGLYAIMLIMATGLENSNFQMVSRWMVGTFWGTSWKHVLSLLIYLGIMVPFTLAQTRHLDVLVLGDSVATGLGLGVERKRRLLLFLSVGLAAACIAVCGGLSFIGLVAPHIARRVLGAQHQFLLLGSALIGMTICMTADSIGRGIFQPTELPAGVIVSILATPYFLYLLRRQYR
mgnify:CR=1 FL=1